MLLSEIADDNKYKATKKSVIDLAKLTGIRDTVNVSIENDLGDEYSWMDNADIDYSIDKSYRLVGFAAKINKIETDKLRVPSNLSVSIFDSKIGSLISCGGTVYEMVDSVVGRYYVTDKTLSSINMHGCDVNELYIISLEKEFVLAPSGLTKALLEHRYNHLGKVISSVPISFGTLRLEGHESLRKFTGLSLGQRDLIGLNYREIKIIRDRDVISLDINEYKEFVNAILQISMKERRIDIEIREGLKIP